MLKASQPDFKQYCQQVLNNAQALAKRLKQRGVNLITGGTENHLLVINVIDSFGLDGQKAQRVLDQVGITTNKQIIPDDLLPPFRPSGIRIGTPAATTRGMVETDMLIIADWIADALENHQCEDTLIEIRSAVEKFCEHFDVPGL